MRSVCWILLAQSVACASVCFSQENISIPELLEFKTRTQALQQYLLHTDRMAEILGWSDVAVFAKAHRNITVLPSVDRRAGKRLYAVAWDCPVDPELAPRPPTSALLPLPSLELKDLSNSDGKNQLIHPARLELAVFDEEGSCVPRDGASCIQFEGIVADLNADGAIEVMELKEYESVRYVMVRQLTGEAPMFAAAFEWGPAAKNREPWGVAARRGEAGDFDLLFGPKRGDVITPEKVFHWDARLGSWDCEDPSDHLWVLGLKNVWKDIVQLAEGKLEKKPRVRDPFEFTPFPPLNSTLPGRIEIPLPLPKAGTK